MQKQFFVNDYIWDIETYPNIFTFTSIHSDGTNLSQFEISDRRNQTEELLAHLRKLVSCKSNLVGFNNVGFDYAVLHHILMKAKYAFSQKQKMTITAQEIYSVAMDIIKNPSRFGSAVKEADVIIPQVDLYLIHHFDNKARATSLKMLEFNMRSDNIEDLPFPVGKHLNDAEKDILLKYNKHDVMETLKFYWYSYEAIALRKQLTAEYGFDCTNFNDTKIGKELFIRTLEGEKPGCCYTQSVYGRKINQTKRDKIVIKDCLFPYIKFDRPEFRAVLDWFKSQTITETKGVFSDIEEQFLGDVAKYADMVVKRKKFKVKPTDEDIAEFKKEHPLGWIEEEELKSTEYAFDEDGNHIYEERDNGKGGVKLVKKRTQKKSYWCCWNVSETLNVIINGFRYDYGVGGIHGAKQGTHVSTDVRKIRTLDVASYYPNMAISNGIYPKHLGQTFCKVYKDLYQQRKKQPKGSAANAALKLALNGVYGDSNNEYSPLYDPAYTMSITIGGQLSLCMLMEKLINHCDAEIIMCNTDGFEYIVDVDKVEEADKWVKWWEDVTGLQMEGDTYSKMYIRDVNSYIAVTESGKVKLKGAYEYMDFDKLGWHKNHSAMVIPMAAKAHLLDGVDYEEFIRLHENKYDFMLRTKVPRSSRLVIVTDDGEEIEQQNICRYYPSKEGGYLVKIMPPLEKDGEWRRFGIDADWKVKTCNNMKDFKWDVNYDYYINEAKKLVDAVMANDSPE